MGFYKEQLKKAEENKINVWKTYIADEVNSFLESADLEYTDEDFERCCEFVYNYCRYSQATPKEVAQALIETLEDEENDFTFDSFNTDYVALDDFVANKICSMF